MDTKHLTAKELKLMEEYAGIESQNTDAVGDWYTATYHENVLRLIAEHRAMQQVVEMEHQTNQFLNDQTVRLAERIDDLLSAISDAAAAV